MNYILFRDGLDDNWKPLLNEQDKTRLTFVSAREAYEATAELARGSNKHFVSVDESGKFISLICTGKTPYSDSDPRIAQLPPL